MFGFTNNSPRLQKKLASKNFGMIILLSLLVVVFLTFTLIYCLVFPEMIARSKNQLFKLRWGLEIYFEGGKKAYEDFKHLNFRENIIVQHENAHLFGLLLYKNYGVSGIRYCDDSFSYGCYHILTGSAIAEEGISAVGQIIEICRTLPNPDNTKSCQHGIGHGLLSYFGYSQKGINQSLSECGKIEKKNSETCSSGVFMENNFQNMHTGLTLTRQFVKSNPLYPCDVIQEDSRPGCYFQQTFWWLKAMSGTNSQRLNLIDTICSKLNGKESDSCYKGLANNLPAYTDLNSKEVKKLCGELTLPINRKLCLIKSANVFSNVYGEKNKAREICNDLEKNDQKSCI